MVIRAIAISALVAACGGDSDVARDSGPQSVEVYFSSITVGEDSTCDVMDKQDNTAPVLVTNLCWGGNDSGILATRDEQDRSEPVPVLTELNLRRFTSGVSHRCAFDIATDFAYCWGANDSGQLGIGNLDGPQLKPQPVADEIPWSFITAGTDHTCGIAVDQHAYCWGSNAFGQLGNDSDTAEELRPVPVAGGYFFTGISAGDRFTCAVALPDYALYCWGLDSQGQLGDGGTITGMETSFSRRPVKVDTNLPFFEVSAGGAFACAIDMTQTAYCWGDNESGQLGNGGGASKSSPVRVLHDEEMILLDAGGRHVCAEDNFAHAWCWGANEHGQLGVPGPIDFSPEPVPVAGDMMFSEVVAAKRQGEHTCGVSNVERAVYCWGQNDRGQLGNGMPTGERVDTPQPVTGQP